MAWLATRRRALLWTMALLLSACGGGVTKTTDPPPSSSAPTTRGPIDLGTLPTASAAATTLASSLPPGVTEADRAAVERAAKEWWEAVYRMADALPAYDPSPLLEMSTASAPGVQETLATFLDLSHRKFVSKKGRIRDIRVENVRFLNERSAEAATCVADDGSYVGPDGIEESPGLTADLVNLDFEKDQADWQVSGMEHVRSLEVGLPCAAQ